MSRIQSASSINTYKQCPRKYYYSYKLELPKTESIQTLTGKAVHDTLEKFFKIPTAGITKENYQFILKHHLLNLFNEVWMKFLPELIKLENDKNTIRKFYQDSLYMLENFITDYLKAISVELTKIDFEKAIEKLKPQTEIYMQSEKYNVRGYIDAIIEIDGEVYIIDYKTSSKDEMTGDYQLQLAIYAMMYQEKEGKLPNKLALHFLRHGTKKFLEVTPELIEKAKKECELIKVNTSSDDIKDYEKNPGYYCKWRTGQCSFYDVCYGVKTLKDY